MLALFVKVATMYVYDRSAVFSTDPKYSADHGTLTHIRTISVGHVCKQTLQ